MRALSLDELQRLPVLYRAALSSLSVARTIALDRNLLLYLEGLAVRSFLVVYGPRTRAWEGLASFFGRELPAAVRSARWHILIATLALFVGTAAGFLLTVQDESWFTSLVPTGLVQGRGPSATRDDLARAIFGPWPGWVASFGIFAGVLFNHNTLVGISTFGLGMAAGIPTIILTAYQGLPLGAFIGLRAAKQRLPRTIVRVGALVIMVGALAIVAAMNTGTSGSDLSLGLTIFGLGSGIMASQIVEILDRQSGAHARVLVSLGFNCFSWRPVLDDGPREMLWAEGGFDAGDKRPSGSGIPSNAIGSIVFDPNDPTGKTLYVGTGEPNGSSDSEAGVGLYKSTDFGKSWTLVPGSAASTAPCATGPGTCPVATGRSIAAIGIDPANPNHIIIGTAVVTIPRIVPVGQASFCVRRALTGGSSTTGRSASGVLTLSLPGGKVEATLSETYGPRRAAGRAYSAIGMIQGGTGRYQDVEGHIRGLGLVTVDRQGRECRMVTLRLDLEPLKVT